MPTVIGYNHNIACGSHVIHIQTEDSGRAKSEIVTQAFLNGAIVASEKVSYPQSATLTLIQDLAKQAHRGMVRKLAKRFASSKATQALPPPAPSHPQPPLPSPVEEAAIEPQTPLQQIRDSLDMSNIEQTLEELRSSVSGALGAALVDYESGMCLGTSGTGLNMEVAAAGNMEVMKAKSRVMRDLGIQGGIEDILITLQDQYHIIRPVGPALFLYLAFDRAQGNLAMARHKMAAAGKNIRV